jgi:hypothetical protein
VVYLAALTWSFLAASVHAQPMIYYRQIVNAAS